VFPSPSAAGFHAALIDPLDGVVAQFGTRRALGIELL
jgi:hypothetical protein